MQRIHETGGVEGPKPVGQVLGHGTEEACAGHRAVGAIDGIGLSIDAGHLEAGGHELGIQRSWTAAQIENPPSPRHRESLARMVKLSERTGRARDI
ncbi:MAG: hypothetical protein P8Z80_01405 [Pseudolabrys sp.]